jgi:hypothetical protein
MQLAWLAQRIAASGCSGTGRGLCNVITATNERAVAGNAHYLAF